MNVLALVLPIAFVAHNILQVLVTLDIFRTNDVSCITDYLFGQTNLAGNLYGETAAWSTNGKLEQSLHLVAVVEHRTVHHTFVVFCKVLQILIVGGYHTPCLFVHELCEYSFGNGSTNLWFCTRAELVDKQQGLVVGIANHVLHVQQVRRVSRQVVLYALLVTDVNHHFLEYAHCAVVTNWYAQSALKHVLQ